MKIELRKWTSEDEQALMHIFNEMNRDYIRNSISFPFGKEDAEKWLSMASSLDGKNAVYRAIVVDGEYVGNIWIKQKDDVACHDSEIAYLLLTEVWSKGIMTEAVRQICRIAFEQLDIIRITGVAFSANTASQRVMEKNGFQPEGRTKYTVWKDGKLYDSVMYGLVDEDRVRALLKSDPMGNA